LSAAPSIIAAHRRRGRTAVLGTCVVALVLATAAAPGTAATQRSQLEGGYRALLDDQGEIFVESLPRNGEGMLGFAERMCGSAGKSGVITASNRGRSRLLKGIYYRVPLDELRPELQQRALMALFPRDRMLSVGWRHEVGAPPGRSAESLWGVARWVCEPSSFQLRTSWTPGSLKPVTSFLSVCASLISISTGGPSKLKAVSTVAGEPRAVSLAMDKPRQPVVIRFVVMRRSPDKQGGTHPYFRMLPSVRFLRWWWIKNNSKECNGDSTKKCKYAHNGTEPHPWTNVSV